MNAPEYQSLSERDTLRSCIIPPPPNGRERLLFAVHVARRIGLHRTWLGRVLGKVADRRLGIALPKRGGR